MAGAVVLIHVVEAYYGFGHGIKKDQYPKDLAPPPLGNDLGTVLFL
jgi:hypothetical protein